MKKILLASAFALFGTFAMAETQKVKANIQFDEAVGVCIVYFYDANGNILFTETYNTISQASCDRIAKARLAAITQP